MTPTFLTRNPKQVLVLKLDNHSENVSVGTLCNPWPIQLYGKLCTATRFICCSQCCMLSIQKTLCRIQFFLLRSFSHFERFLTTDQPFLVDNYLNLHWARLPSQEAAAHPAIFFGDVHLLLSLKQNVSEIIAKLSKPLGG